MQQVSILKKELAIPSLMTVSKLSYLVKLKLEGVPVFQNIHVVGEIAEITHKGNIYLTLKDEKTSLRCVFFDPSIEFELERGLDVVVFGNVSSYSQNSSYQLVISSIIPVGEGAQALKLKQLKKKFREQGLFDNKKPLPILPSTLGLITAEESAAYGDILKAIKHRFPHTHLLVKYSKVQGVDAIPTIINAIEELNQRTKNMPDMILLTRGGGGSTDLEVFNNELVARAIHNSKIPIVTAIGHDRDIHVSDLVADAHFSTPTSAINEIFPSAIEYKERLSGLSDELTLNVDNYFKNLKQIKERKILYVVISILVAMLMIVMGVMIL